MKRKRKGRREELRCVDGESILRMSYLHTGSSSDLPSRLHRMTRCSQLGSAVDALGIIFSNPGSRNPACPAAQCKEPCARRSVVQVSPHGGEHQTLAPRAIGESAILKLR